MSDNVRIDQLAEAVMKGLTEYADLATDDMKKAVKSAGRAVRKEIEANAPADTGKYSKSWRAKTTKETSNSLEVMVCSPTKYQLAHLLEHGHAKRGGGRTKAQPHIAPAEELGVKQLEKEIERSLRMDKILEVLQAAGIPFAYDHFAEGEAVDPPFICYLLPGSDNFAADGKVYHKISRVNIELYTDKKDLNAEQKVEDALDAASIFYAKSEVWIDSEKLYEVLYEMEV